MHLEIEGKQRIDYYDTAKGILILLVVIGHIFETGPVNQYVYSFHMPAFFMVSGIMMNYSSAMKKPLHTAIMDKAFALLIPFLFFEVIGVLSNIVRFGVTLNVFGYASNTLKLWCNNGPDWFIWALFVDEVLFLTVHKLIHNKYLIWITTIVIGTFMAINHNFYSTFGSTGIGFMFFTLGYYAKPLFEGERKPVLVFLFGIISLTCGMVNGKVDLGTWTFGNVFRAC